MTQGVPAWGERKDDSSIEAKEAGRRPALDVGYFYQGLVFPARLRVSEMQGSPLNHLSIRGGASHSAR